MIPNYYNPYLAPVQVPQAAPRNDSGINWVQGEAAAKSYLVAPNTSVFLMDSEKNTFYIKSADASGMPLPLRVFDYTERQTTSNNIPAAATDVYVTHEELERRLAELTAKPGRKGAKESDE